MFMQYLANICDDSLPGNVKNGEKSEEPVQMLHAAPTAKVQRQVLHSSEMWENTKYVF